MTANVIPKLRQYLTWLESMLPSEENSEGLKIIHNRLVEGYRTIIAAFDTFVTDLNEDNIEDRYRVLMEAMGELARMEESYGAQLKNFYAKNRVRMMEDTFHLIPKPAVAVEGQEAPVAAEGEPPVPAEAPPTEVPPAEVPPAEVPPAQAPPAEPTGGGH